MAVEVVVVACAVAVVAVVVVAAFVGKGKCGSAVYGVPFLLSQFVRSIGVFSWLQAADTVPEQHVPCRIHCSVPQCR